MLSRICCYQHKWKKVETLNWNLRLLQFLIILVIKWITFKRFDVFTASNQEWPRWSWFSTLQRLLVREVTLICIHIYYRFARVCNIFLQFTLCSLRCPFCFCVCSFSSFFSCYIFFKISIWFISPLFAICSYHSSRFSEILRFLLFLDIFIRLNDIRSKLSNIRQRGEKAVRMRPSFFIFLSITNYTTYVVHGTIIECRVHRGLYFHSILSLRIGRKMR